MQNNGEAEVQGENIASTLLVADITQNQVGPPAHPAFIREVIILYDVVGFYLVRRRDQPPHIGSLEALFRAGMERSCYGKIGRIIKSAQI